MADEACAQVDEDPPPTCFLGNNPVIHPPLHTESRVKLSDGQFRNWSGDTNASKSLSPPRKVNTLCGCGSDLGNIFFPY